MNRQAHRRGGRHRDRHTVRDHGVRSDVPILKRIVLRTAVWLSPAAAGSNCRTHTRAARLQPKGAHGIDITVSGMGMPANSSR